MKIAYLIAASGNYAHLRRLVRALDDTGVHFYIHIDLKSPMPDNLGDFPNVTFVPRVKVWWAGFSQVRATLNMMREAVKGRYDYYAFISGGDYPVKPNALLYETLARGGEFINAVEGFQSHKPRSRVEYYHLDCYNRRGRDAARYFFRSIELGLRFVARKRRYPFRTLWHGGSWWVLSNGCVRYILDYVDANPRYVSFYKTALCPDESFFQTIIAHSPFLNDVRGNLTYTDWSAGGSGPAFISEKHLPMFVPGETCGKQCEPFFARKFTDASADVVDMIEKGCRL